VAEGVRTRPVLTFGVLGPLEALDGGRVIELPRRKHRALLSVLLLGVGERISSDRLIEDLWGETPPRTARDALQNYVSLLRRELGADLVVTTDGGYALEIEPNQLDLCRFQRWCAEASPSVVRERSMSTHARGADFSFRRVAYGVYEYRGTLTADNTGRPRSTVTTASSAKSCTVRWPGLWVAHTGFLLS